MLPRRFKLPFLDKPFREDEDAFESSLEKRHSISFCSKYIVRVFYVNFSSIKYYTRAKDRYGLNWLNVHSFIFSKHIFLVRVTADPALIPGTW